MRDLEVDDRDSGHQSRVYPLSFGLPSNECGADTNVVVWNLDPRTLQIRLWTTAGFVANVVPHVVGRYYQAEQIWEWPSARELTPSIVRSSESIRLRYARCGNRISGVGEALAQKLVQLVAKNARLNGALSLDEGTSQLFVAFDGIRHCDVFGVSAGLAIQWIHAFDGLDLATLQRLSSEKIEVHLNLGEVVLHNSGLIDWEVLVERWRNNVSITHFRAEHSKVTRGIGYIDVKGRKTLESGADEIEISVSWLFHTATWTIVVDKNHVTRIKMSLATIAD
jgi:hypothetical protein